MRRPSWLCRAALVACLVGSSSCGSSGGAGGNAGTSGTGGGGTGGTGGTPDAGDVPLDAEAPAPDLAGPTADSGAVTGADKIVLLAGGGSGDDGGPATMAKMNNPYGTVVDPMTGDIYIAEALGQRVRKVDSKGIISSVVGVGAMGAAALKLDQPHDLLFQPGTRNLFIADTMASRILLLDPTTGMVTVFAGRGTNLDPNAGIIYCLAFSPTGDKLYFTTPANIQVLDVKTKTLGAPINYATARVIAIDSKGTLYAVKNNGNVLQTVDATGKTADMPGTSGVIAAPKHITTDLDDNVLIADTEKALIRKYVVATKTLVTIAGNGTVGTGTLDGSPLKAQVSRPHGIFVDKMGRIYISDSENNRVLEILH